MNKLGIELDLNYSISNTKFDYSDNSIIFLTKIIIGDDIVEIAASPRCYYSHNENIDNEKLKKTLFKSTITHFQNDVPNYKRLDLFDFHKFSINNEIFQADNECQIDNYIELSLEINDDLYKFICSEILKYEVIKAKFERTKDYLFNLNWDQVKYDVSIVQKCFSMISSCFASSLDQQHRISDLNYIKNCFLATKLKANDFEFSKRILYSMMCPHIFISKPMIFDKIDYVYEN